ncbi:hypothetical protein ACFFUB_06840 [Algimonas porphyrae]|nr:hypothetical protein [Algimonas porphyrae]
MAILDDSDHCNHVMTTLYTSLFEKSRDRQFCLTWPDLIKLARREALIYKISEGETLADDKPGVEGLTDVSRGLLQAILGSVSDRGGAS